MVSQGSLECQNSEWSVKRWEGTILADVESSRLVRKFSQYTWACCVGWEGLVPLALCFSAHWTRTVRSLQLHTAVCNYTVQISARSKKSGSLPRKTCFSAFPPSHANYMRACSGKVRWVGKNHGSSHACGHGKVLLLFIIIMHTYKRNPQLFYVQTWTYKLNTYMCRCITYIHIHHIHHIHACMHIYVRTYVHTYTVHTTVCIQIDWFDLDLDCFSLCLWSACMLVMIPVMVHMQMGILYGFVQPSVCTAHPGKKKALKEKNAIRSHQITWPPLKMKLTKVAP